MPLQRRFYDTGGNVPYCRFAAQKYTQQQASIWGQQSIRQQGTSIHESRLRLTVHHNRERLSSLHIPDPEVPVTGCGYDVCARLVECDKTKLICVPVKFLVQRAGQNIPDAASVILPTGCKPISVGRESDYVFVGRT